MTEHVDVLIVGAGLSGVGAACRLRMERPATTFLVVEARDRIGGTWDLFRYPGIRSDSDMFTLGYGFRPWDGDKAIAAGDDIRDYIEATAREYGVDERIRFNRRVVALEWDSGTGQWTAEVERGGGEGAEGRPPHRERITADFVYSCTGYYRYDRGYLPDFPGVDRYRGRLIHPQHWPEDLDVTGRRVVVIGSGATAMTLVPALAGTADEVVMLQRSPSYVISLSDVDPVADWLRAHLPARTAHTFVKWKNIALSTLLYQLSKRAPGLVRRVLITRLARELPDGFDVATHFNPRYDPWDQRLCLVPNNDLFRALRAGQASIVTDHIETFTEDGIALRSGEHLDADVVVAATGLELLMMGGMDIRVDGRTVDVGSTVAYKGMMLSGVPNFVFAVGYVNASWTLKADLVSAYFCRLLDHMDHEGYRQVTPRRPRPDEPTSPLLDLDAGYVKRAIPLLPRQGAREPWALHQNYLRDVALFRRGELDDEGVEFHRTPVSPVEHLPAPAA